MPIIIEDEDKPRELHPSGLHQAVCVSIVDLGLQRSNFNGKEKIQRKGLFIWESSQKMADGSPFIVTKKYTLSMFDKANLRGDLEGWAGKKFTDEQVKRIDIEVFQGKNCLLNFVHSDDGKYANVTGINPLMEGMAKMAPTMREIPEGLGKWVAKMRSEAVPTQADPGSPPPPHSEDDLPF